MKLPYIIIHKLRSISPDRYVNYRKTFDNITNIHGFCEYGLKNIVSVLPLCSSMMNSTELIGSMGEIISPAF